MNELKDNSERVDNFITEEIVNSHFKNEFVPKKILSHLILKRVIQTKLDLMCFVFIIWLN